MADDNATTGQYLYASGDAETRAWLEKQWRIWLEHADEMLTTNISLHYGGVVAYRIENETEPLMSHDFSRHVVMFDKFRTAQSHPMTSTHKHGSAE